MFEKLTSLCRYDISTLTGNNLAFLQRKYDCKSVEELCENRLKISKNSFKEMLPQDQWKIPLIEELVSFRDGLETTELTKDEIEEILLYVTTS